METKVRALSTHQTAGDIFYNLEITDARGTHTEIFSEITVNEIIRKGVVVEDYPIKNGVVIEDYFLMKKPPSTSADNTAKKQKRRKNIPGKKANWTEVSDELVCWLKAQGSKDAEINFEIKYDMYGDDTHDAFEIQGHTYNLSIYIDQYMSFSCETTHKQRFKETDDIDIATANRVEPKTLKGVKGYITKWIEI
ncbi:hypothetical protein CN918_28915 [Priestia megaterium]|nr:hypothetical protein CN918_28915 [Priestia megaterium]